MPPSELPFIPDNAHLLAWDHHRRKVVAYDVNRKFLGNVATPHSRSIKRQAKGTACTLVDQSTLRFGECLSKSLLVCSHSSQSPGIICWKSMRPRSGVSVLAAIPMFPPTLTLFTGADWDNIHTNPSEYPDRGASVCVQDVPPTMTLDGPSVAALLSFHPISHMT